MSFPEFLPTVPVFVRTLAKRHKSTTLITLDDARVSYADAESHSARPAGGTARTRHRQGGPQARQAPLEVPLAKRIDG